MNWKTITLSLILTSLATPALATTCKIVGVADGDTATCLTHSKKQIKVRFDQIDAPEKAQDYGTKSKQVLSDMIFGKEVNLKIRTTDRYGRSVAEVFLGHTNINKEMVKKGYAWAYREYNVDSEYLALEGKAKSAKLGLWSQPNPVYPSDFRKSKKSGSNNSQGQKNKSNSLPINNQSSGASCGSKRYCSQMTSCSEARYFLKTCGVSSLDRDGDGTPCESLCR